MKLPGTHILHTVEHGDTLYSLANRYNSSVDDIVRSNGIYPPFTDPGLIYPGQLLVISDAYLGKDEVLYVVNRGDTMYQIATRFLSHPDMIAGITSGVQNPNFIFPYQPLRLPVMIYLVQTGDSIASISERTGVPIDGILTANQNRPSISPDVLYEGLKLIIPLPTSQNIAVFAPSPGDIIESDVFISGYARAFEANVLMQVIDAQGNSLTGEQFTTAQYAAPVYAPFETTLTLEEQPATDEGYLQVYTRSAKDGSIQDLTQIKVYFNE
ncbi:LysM peptidoglycan-binding domain-containing protein [Bacillus shivajii]|uniref:LysM peptidoglycan-binding domain-containing protein n=1 Tax=Bacillus shivajii TaxID=1983719 RepID=UPI001CFB0103|nr:LysM peptidoglycan-binding domain-containing protein [Bacillus shivajii]UCZ55152.1 LysM peptidoglycan-binding domain-containing protein [Bacillus shivajii]